jgi:alkylation response protein AidB-like acyl-CoA dehydrogenase
MRLTPDADAEELRGVVRAFLDKHCPPEPRDEPGWDPAVWSRFAGELGAAGLDVPERFGGAGATFREVAVVAEETGRCVARLPWFGTAVLAVGALREIGDATLLERLVSGEATGTLAVADAHLEGGRLTGTALRVVDGATADVLLVAAGGGLHVVEPDAPGLIRTPMRVLDPSRPLATLTFDATPARELLADAGALLERVRTRAGAALAAEQTGGAAAATEAAVAYAGQRIQFGRPIGTFQAIKHRCADMAVRVEAARSASAWAAAAMADDDPEASLAGATAGVVCGEAYTWVAGESVQVHGGIGFTWEHTAHLHVRRAATSAVLLDPHSDREAILHGIGV